MNLRSPMIHSVRAGRRLLNRRGYDVHRHWPSSVDPLFPADMEPAAIPLMKRAAPYTMTSRLRLYAMYQAVRYVTSNGIPGSIVECGVWRGGTMLLAADALAQFGVTDRDLYLFDTFEGLTEAGPEDIAINGISGRDWTQQSNGEQAATFRCEAHVDEVKALMATSSYPADRMHFIEGRVEDTVPGESPTQIALLRLDTDWYESTKHEMEHLYERVTPGGVVIIDDYGWWKGARRAIDEYFDAAGGRPLLQRIDETGRLLIVPPRVPATATLGSTNAELS
jgi:O-methyltransferase